ncbi:hypothetical protein ACFP3Q_14350 [Nocardioides sp. GCM10027113]|uniref:hypothetical protein n=1 Tax=unclassified Nocardioides TaxID=2615069 RepID=UPI00361DAFD3
MTSSRHYVIKGLSDHQRRVRVWSARPIPFETPPAAPWLRDLVDDLRDALAQVHVTADEALCGYYDSAEDVACDVENRLFTNPGRAIPPVARLRFERGPGTPPGAPSALDGAGERAFYEYDVDGRWHHWRPDAVLVSWERLEHRGRSDDTAKPWWVTMRRGMVGDQVHRPTEVHQPPEEFGVRLVVHLPAGRRRSAKAVSEQVVDGVLAAFHPVPSPAAVADPLAAALPDEEPEELRLLLDQEPWPLLFTSPALRVSPRGRVVVSPEDHRCVLGDVAVRDDSTSQGVQLSGALVTVRRVEPADA